jgi:hypothetical protein
MVDQPQGRAGEASPPRPPTRHGEPDPRTDEPRAATDPPPTPAEQAQRNQDDALASGEENVV